MLRYMLLQYNYNTKFRTYQLPVDRLSRSRYQYRGPMLHHYERNSGFCPNT